MTPAPEVYILSAILSLKNIHQILSAHIISADT